MTPSILSIQRAVAAYDHVPVASMSSPSRKRDFAWPRQEAIYLAIMLTDKSWNVISRYFGNRDRATLYHARRAILTRMKGDETLRQRLRRVTLEVCR